MRATLAYARVVHIEDCPDIGPTCQNDPPPEPYWHDVKTLVSEIPLEVSYGVLPWLAVEARVPLRVVGVWPEYSTLAGTELPIIDEHHRRETLVGPADPWLTARVAGTVSKFSASARLGLSLPVGRTEPDPYALGRLGLPHQHIQFGSGTVMPVLGGFFQRAWSRVEVGIGVLGVVSLADNAYGYRSPSRAFVSLRATAPLLEGKLRPFVATDFNLESTELWHGRVGDEGSTERVDFLVGGGVAWQLAKSWSVDATFRIRAAKFAHGSTLDYPGFLQVGGTWMLDTGSSASSGSEPNGSAPSDDDNSNW